MYVNRVRRNCCTSKTSIVDNIIHKVIICTALICIIIGTKLTAGAVSIYTITNSGTTLNSVETEFSLPVGFTDEWIAIRELADLMGLEITWIDNKNNNYEMKIYNPNSMKQIHFVNSQRNASGGWILFRGKSYVKVSKIREVICGYCRKNDLQYEMYDNYIEDNNIYGYRIYPDSKDRENVCLQDLFVGDASKTLVLNVIKALYLLNIKSEQDYLYVNEQIQRYIQYNTDIKVDIADGKNVDTVCYVNVDKSEIGKCYISKDVESILPIELAVYIAHEAKHTEGIRKVFSSFVLRSKLRLYGVSSVENEFSEYKSYTYQLDVMDRLGYREKYLKALSEFVANKLD